MNFNKIKTIPQIHNEPGQAGYRLDSLEYIIKEYLGKRQDWIQFGVSSGHSARKIVTHLPKSNRLFLLDSFKGLPSDWNKGKMKKGTFSNAVIPSFKEKNVYIIQSLFKDAYDKLKAYGINITFAHIDCDLYESAVDALKLIEWYFYKECYLLFDEFYNYPEYEKHEYKAFFEFTKKYDLSYQSLFKTAGNQVAFKIWRE
jgi:hypothetical protein